ncbi:MAG TPA: tol-pal system protein YbgF [Thermoanaerobaculia bacterium]|nr:tol-pal system protein YbgF [Thermoanaerobaculia bacterium]
MTFARLIPMAVAAALFTACASTGDVERLQNQVAELQEELAGLKRTTAAKEEVQNVNQRIAEQTEQLLRSNATLVAKVDQMDQGLQNTQGTIEQANYRIDRLAQQLTQFQRDLDMIRGRVESATPPDPSGAPMSEVTVPAPVVAPAPVPATGDPVDVYQAAYRDYQRGNFDLAIAGFREFIRQSPNSDLADNASYWIGESLFSQQKYPEAIAQFDSVVTQYPRSDKVPGALLKKGFSYLNINERAQGIVQLQYVVHEHPSSSEAALARQRLRQLGIETR